MKRFALLLALLLAACANQPMANPEAPKPSAGVPGGACPAQISEGKKISFGPGNALAGVVLGAGRRGAVLTHELNANLCQWVPAAKELLARGYRVLLFDVNGFGASPRITQTAAQDVAEGVKVLRELGADTILLMGASMGGSAVVTAAAEVTPAVIAVVSVSGAKLIASMSAIDAAPKLTMPVLYLSAEFDAVFTTAATQLHEASRASKDARLHIIAGGSGHGVSLVSPGGDAGARNALASFLKTHIEG